LLHADPEALADQLAALQSLLNCSQVVLGRVVGHEPSLLITNVELIDAKLRALAAVFNATVEQAAAVATARAPGLLTLSVSNIEASFAELKVLLPLGNPHQLALRAPSLLAYSRATLQRKVEQLRNVLALPLNEVLKLVSLAPSLLTCDVEANLEPKIRELQVLFARKPATQGAWQQAEAVRTVAALKVLVGQAVVTAASSGKTSGGRSGSPARGCFLSKGGTSSKASLILQARLKLKMAQSTFAGAGSKSNSSRNSSSSSDCSSDSSNDSSNDSSASDGASSSITSSSGNRGASLLSPLLPRAEAVRLICAEPTLLQRNVSQSLAPKLALLRALMQPVVLVHRTSGEADDGAWADDALAASADEVIRAQPRVLLSSFGVIGRVAFLAHLARNHVRAETTGEAAVVTAAEAVGLSQQPARLEEEREEDAGSLDRSALLEASVNSAAVKSAVREPRARFFDRHPTYAGYLKEQVRAHAQAAEGNGADEDHLQALSPAQLETRHGDILKASVGLGK
jgi:hypothetical protein